MNFQKKKIRDHIPEPEKPKIAEVLKDKLNGAKKFNLSFGIITSVAIIAILVIAIVKTVASIDFNFFLKAAGDELKTDAYNHTNFLILGTGGKNHDGSDLTDTMIIASLDDDNKLITLVSIPRDIYVKDELIGNSKINEVYYNAKRHYQNSAQALDHLKSKIETQMGIPIHYYLKVDFDGFKELVDALGGVDVYVETPIYDPYYPKDGTYLYEPFSISAGQHHLDGETALKYARSRKTTSDFDRAERQQQIIYAIKEKALQSEVIFSPERISAIMETLKENIETNITVKEILTLGSLAGDYSSDKILHRLIHDDPTQCGGFLYTPAREYYGGMFVLLPAGGFEFVHKYSDLNFNFPTVAKENIKIHVLNGTKTGGVAGETKQILKRFCFDVVRFGNGQDTSLTQTIYYYKEAKDADGEIIKGRPESLNFLQKLIPGQESTIIPPGYEEYMLNADVIIELGTDYVNSEKYIDDPYYSLPQLKSATPATSPTTDIATPEATPTPAAPAPTPSTTTP